MPPSDSSALIVARFLKANQYEESYQAFIEEAGLSEIAGIFRKGDLTLETLLEEKRTFDLSLRFEKLGTRDARDATKAWSEPAPATAHTIDVLPTSSNLLSVTVEATSVNQSASSSILFTSSADRRLHLLDLPSRRLRASVLGLQDSPILSCAVLEDQMLLTTSMSGQLLASDFDGNVIARRRDHAKYAVKVATFSTSGGPLIATAGWDCKVNIYKLSTSPFQFNEPLATISLLSKPEAMLLVTHPDNDEPVLLVTRTDSNYIYYYSAESEPRLLGKQNLAPHSNAWVAFTPSALALCPKDSSIVAVGTSTVPHMKMLIVRLLFPPWEPPAQAPPVHVRTSLLDDSPATETQASQARAALAIADREDAAIKIHCNTFAPQTAYSTPAVAWRPDGSGVWVNGDDGAIRGIEASTGKVISTLQEGHEEGSKVRCIWAGEVDGEEILVSGGFDQRLIVWQVS